MAKSHRLKPDHGGASNPIAPTGRTPLLIEADLSRIIDMLQAK
jgi:hypothetical protein